MNRRIVYFSSSKDKRGLCFPLALNDKMNYAKHLFPDHLTFPELPTRLDFNEGCNQTTKELPFFSCVLLVSKLSIIVTLDVL